MFTHKKVIQVVRGEIIPFNAKYLRTEYKEIKVNQADPKCYKYRDEVVELYEVPCNEDGSTNLSLNGSGKGPSEYYSC